ncbi:MAG: hypothetical protein ACKVOU_07175 [Cytophagales bacterium]
MSKRLLWVIFSFGIFANGYAQTMANLKYDAVLLMDKGDHKKAIPLLKRCLFFADTSSKFDILVQLGDANVAIDSFENAHTFYQSALQLAPNDSLSDELIFKATALFLKQRNSKQALQMMENNLKSLNSSYFTERKYFYQALAHFKLQNYKAAEHEFQQCFQAENQPLSDSIHLVFEKLSRTHFYNPKKAKTLSKILPGLGQLYTKDYKNSLNSFGLNAGLLALGIWSAIIYTPFDGIIWIAPWLRRYYVGGYKKAELIAISQNEKIENWYLMRIMNILSPTSEAGGNSNEN